MGATTTQLTTLVHDIARDFPAITLVKGDTFAYSPVDNTIQYETSTPDWQYYLLHELGHALCGHTDFHLDIDLLKMEREAWERSHQLTHRYHLPPPPTEIVESALDSYRDWLHKRSSCPTCRQSGIQKKTSTYTCLICNQQWSVTKEKVCRPYRKKVAKKS